MSENPPQSLFENGGGQVPPFCKGGLGGGIDKGIKSKNYQVIVFFDVTVNKWYLIIENACKI